MGLPEADSLSVRWTGSLSVPESGTYNIGLDGTDSSLWIEAKPVVDNSTPRRSRARSVDLAFEKDRKYEIKLEQTPAQGPLLTLVWSRVIDHSLQRAAAAAKAADVVVAVTGISSALEGKEMNVNVAGFSGGDRTSLDMPKEEEDLLEAVKATGRKLVVVLINGSALSLNWACWPVSRPTILYLTRASVPVAAPSSFTSTGSKVAASRTGSWQRCGQHKAQNAGQSLPGIPSSSFLLALPEP